MMALEFDFETRTTQVSLAIDALRAGEGRRYVWYDLDISNEPNGLADLFTAQGLEPEIVAALSSPPTEIKFAYRVFPGGLTLNVGAPVTDDRDERLGTLVVRLVLGERYCATVHNGPVAFLSEVWRTCPEDFRQFAESPGFLLYEFWDHLIADYRRAADVVGDERLLRARSTTRSGSGR